MDHAAPSSVTAPSLQVVVTRVLTADVNGPDGAFRYQGAFLYENYSDLHQTFVANRQYYNQRHRDSEHYLGFRLVARHFNSVKPCITVELPADCVVDLAELGKAFHSGDMMSAMELPQWGSVLNTIAGLVSSKVGGSSGNGPYATAAGYFMKIEETSAKEFTCYYGYPDTKVTNGMDSKEGSTPLLVPTTNDSNAIVMYARDADVPFAQRREFRQALLAKAVAIPGCPSAPTHSNIGSSYIPTPPSGKKVPPPPPPPRPSAASRSVGGSGGGSPLTHYPPLTLQRGLGPFADLRLVLATLIGHDKTQSYIANHALEGATLDLYLLPWDDAMDTNRELRVFVDERSLVVGITPWNPFGQRADDTGRGSTAREGGVDRKAFQWMELLGDADLEQLGREVVAFVEGHIVPVVLASTPFKGFTADVLVQERHWTSAPNETERWHVSLVETGPFGAFMHTGSGLFHWLESDVFNQSGDAHHPRVVHFRLLTDDVGKGVRLSVTKPVRKPDMVD